MQLHRVDIHTGEVIDKPIRREAFLEHFANREPCLIGMEACGGAPHWARELNKLGHKVKLMSLKFVKAFVIGNKNDVMDARAIWMAVQQPGKAVAAKSEGQQSMLVLHKMRRQLVKFRTAQINNLHGLLLEYGETLRRGRIALYTAMPEVLKRLRERLPLFLVETLREQWHKLDDIDSQIDEIEKRLLMWKKQDKACQANAAIPGIGLLTATAAVAAMGAPKGFRSGREFAAWLGLVPKQVGTGERIKLLGISKRDDAYLRTLFIHGARSVLTHVKEPGRFAEKMKQHNSSNVATVANKRVNAKRLRRQLEEITKTSQIGTR